MWPKCRAKLLRHKKKPWGVAFQRTANWEASTTKSAYTGPLHPAVRDSLTGGNEASERGFAKRGLERHQNSPMGPRHIKLNSFSSTLTWALQLGRQNSGSLVTGTHFVQLPVFFLINTRYSPFIPVLSNRRATAVLIKNQPRIAALQRTSKCKCCY